MEQSKHEVKYITSFGSVQLHDIVLTVLYNMDW